MATCYPNLPLFFSISWVLFCRLLYLLDFVFFFGWFLLDLYFFSFAPEIWIDLCFVDYCILVRFGFYLAVFLLDFFSSLWILNSFNSSIKNASKLCTFQVQELIQFSLFLDFLFFFFFGTFETKSFQIRICTSRFIVSHFKRDVL